MDSGETIPGGSPIHAKMHQLSQEAIRITMEINNAYHTHEEIIALIFQDHGVTIGEGAIVAAGAVVNKFVVAKRNWRPEQFGQN
ncbi:MAG: hypothetical protein K2K97_09420 [Muribaculaceae bacterium]|nr:hypothetical protein [Muribaculaceae bacterium]